MKKKLYFAALFIAAISLAACDKTLDEKVYSKLTPELAFTSGENALAANNEMYESLHTAFRTPYFYINDMSTDVCYIQGKCFETLNDDANRTTRENLEYWDGMFKVVARANIVLDNISKMSEGLFSGLAAGEPTKAQMLAQAHFMRAFAYMCLTDAYYQVPLITSSTDDILAPHDYAKIDDIENLIEKDLLATLPSAEFEGLPLSYDNDHSSYPTLGAAKAYLCRLYMRQAGRVRVAGQDATQIWQKALDMVNDVLAMEGTTYQLLPEEFDVFVADNPAGKYNKEIIFAIRATDKVTSGSWDIAMGWTPWNCNLGWDLFRMPLELAWKFEEGDKRFADNMVWKDYISVYDEGAANWVYTYPRSIAEVGLSLKRYAEEHGLATLDSQSEESDAAFTRKYEYYNVWSYNYDTPNSAIVCRFADMILCKAEILNEIMGLNNDSVELLNRIRTRAFGNASHNYALGDFLSDADFRSALCDERAFEFHSEGLRRADLIRMGLWKDRMTKYIDGIKARAKRKAVNEGKAEDYYHGLWAAYPTSLGDKDILMYMPYPDRELKINPGNAAARDYVN